MRRRLLFLAAGLIGLAVAFCVGALLGVLAGEWGAYNRRFVYEQNVIAPVLSADPAFARLEILIYTGDGSALLTGEVPTKADLERLRSKMTELLGRAREDERLAGVWTAEDPHNLAP